MQIKFPYFSPAITANMLSKGKFEVPKHIGFLDSEITDAIACGDAKIMINMPPRHGKSELVSFALPLWHLINFPDKKIILVSYEQTFATQWSRRIRDTIKENAADIGIDVSSDSSAVQYFEIKGRRGSLSAVGAGGPLTGRGADLLIIDDPIKNAEEAMSEAQRDKLFDWFLSVAFSRLEPSGNCILLMTRWHSDDLCGRLLAHQDDWKQLKIPAVAGRNDIIGREEGDALWPERFDIARLKYLEKFYGAFYWESLMQQEPFIREGNYFKRSDFKIIEPDLFIKMYRPHEYRVYCSVDLAISQSEKADYTVFCIFAILGNQIFVFDVIRQRLTFPEARKTALQIHKIWDIELFLVEEVQYQAAFTQSLRENNLPVKAMKPLKDKFTRSLPMQTIVSQGLVSLFNNNYVTAFLDELQSFPGGKHDDMVDAFCYISAVYSKPRFAPVGFKPDNVPLTKDFRY